MSKPTYLHKLLTQSLKDGVVTTYEESIVEGSKGVYVKYFSKDATGKQEKITINGKDDKFVMIVKEGDKDEKKTLTKDELMTELKKNKKLKFAVDFTKTQKGGAWLERQKKSSKSVSSKPDKKSSSVKKVNKVPVKKVPVKKAPVKKAKNGSSK